MQFGLHLRQLPGLDALEKSGFNDHEGFEKMVFPVLWIHEVGVLYDSQSPLRSLQSLLYGNTTKRDE